MTRRRQATAGLSLFPFLDVLCCTMGSLIVLLCVLAKAAKGDLPKPQQPAPDYAPVRRALEAQLAHVRREREDVQSTLAETRQQLSHVEDHARQLREEILQLESSSADLMATRTTDEAQRRALAAERAQMDARLAQLRDALTKAQQAASQAERNYAVVPYDGDSATYRRPIYIECQADAVVLQPEGIVLTEEDFAGPIGPGNPLAAALRASHEYLSFQAADAATIGEPYPLLLVRPDGIGAYYAARAALRSWGSEFGYELIESDWPLAFPAADPQLADAQREAVESAREKRALLARSAPKAYGRGDGRGFHEFSAGVGERGGPLAGRRGGVPGGHSNGSPTVSSPGEPGGGATAAASGQNAQRGGGEQAQRGGAGTTRQQEQLLARHGTKPGQEHSDGTTGGDTAGGSPAASAAKSGASAAGGHTATASKSVAETRGRDWALPNAGPRQIAVSRPIRVLCSASQITILPAEPSRPPKVIPLGERTEDSTDDLVSAIWEHQDSWGMAGNGMYWKPILKVQVAEDGVWRAADLRVLLADSGIVIETDAPPVAQAPPSSDPNRMPRR